MRSSLYAITVVAVAACGAVACSELRAAEGALDADAGAGPNPGEARDADADGGGWTARGGPPGADGGVGPGEACRPLVLGCLDPGAPNVIEVPTESTLKDAFASAKANDVVQIKGASVGAGWRIPAYVTLRGCGGAKLVGAIAFAGSGGVVEGFEVPSQGSIVANTTGSYVVRQNRFTGGAASNEPGVSGRSIDALVSAEVTLLVDGNVFQDRAWGAEARTRYDTLKHDVDITLRNNVFSHVEHPVVVSEAGLAGHVVAKVEHNTFHDFATAIALNDVSFVTKTSGNLFVGGDVAIGGSPYEVAYSFAWEVATPAGSPPNAGTFASGDPRFVDADAGDFRLGAGSSAIDAIPSGAAVPAEDHRGCPRPAGAAGSAPQADVGAFEAQP